MQRIAGSGLGLPFPQTPYPNPLANASYQNGTNEYALDAGQSLVLPAGDWVIDLGKYSVLEVQDPVEGPTTVSNAAGSWRVVRSQRGTFPVRSDGNNYRISNLLGCAIGAVLKDAGSGYTSVPVVAASAGSSSWEAIVGGSLGAFSIVQAGTGYTVAPIVFIPAPPAPGVPATAYAVLSGSTLGSITLTNVGAGYTAIPPVTILPNPFDPGLANISGGSAVASLSNSGKITAVLCVNNGVPVSALSATLTFTGGGGTSGSAVPFFLQTISSISVTTQGSGAAAASALTTVGGVPTAGVLTQPIAEYTDFLPRPGLINLSTSATGSVTGLKGPIQDGGMFLATPTVMLLSDGGGWGNKPVISLNMGSTQDIVMIQPM